MKRFKLIRNVYRPDYATCGTLFTVEPIGQVCVILELPFVDADNDGVRDPNVCRIQHGTYVGIKYKSPSRGYVVPWLCGVPGVTSAYIPEYPEATTCQMHKVIWPWHLEGCLGLGTAFQDIIYEKKRGPEVKDGRYARRWGKPYYGVTGSTAAFDKFMALIKDVEKFELEIVDDFKAPVGAWA